MGRGGECRHGSRVPGLGAASEDEPTEPLEADSACAFDRGRAAELHSTYPGSASSNAKEKPIRTCSQVVGLASFLIAVILGSAFPATGSSCIDYEPFWHWTNAVETEGAAKFVRVAEDRRVYVAVNGGLSIFDASDPSDPRPEVHVALPGNATAFEFAGDFAYVADGDLQVVDLTDPQSAFLSATVSTPGTASGVAVAGTHAYVTDRAAGLHILDISDPSLPVIVGTLDTAGDAYAVALDWPYAYVAGDLAGLQIVEVSDPAAPVLVATINTPGQARGVVFDSEYVYVADGTAGLQIVDATFPESALLVGGINPGTVSHVLVELRVLYVTGGSTLRRIDVQDATNPQLGAAVPVPSAALCAARHTERWWYIAGGSEGLQVVEGFGVADPPMVVGEVEVALGTMVVAGDFGYGEGAAHFRVMDFSDPTEPEVVGSIYHPLASTLSAGDGIVFMVSSGKIHIVDVSTPTAPEIVESFVSVGGIPFLAASGRLAYYVEHVNVGGSGWRLGILDASTPTDPQRLGGVTIGSQSGPVTHAGSHVYVCGPPSHGIQIVDVSNPSAPALVGSVATPSTTWSIAVEGPYAYAVASDSLYVADVSDPTNPVVIGSLWTPGGEWSASSLPGLAAVPGVVYVPGYDAGLWLVDVSIPSAPRIAGQVEGRQTRVALLHGDHIYVAANNTVRSLIPHCPAIPSAVGSSALEVVESGPRATVDVAWPNPTRASTSIGFTLATRCGVNVDVYDVVGRHVRSLVAGVLDDGAHTVVWDRRGVDGARAASGIYFVRLSAEQVPAGALKVVLVDD